MIFLNNWRSITHNWTAVVLDENLPILKYVYTYGGGGAFQCNILFASCVCGGSPHEGSLYPWIEVDILELPSFTYIATG
jgi:hypothetical protein